MPVVTIELLKREFKLNCSEAQKEKLVELAEQLGRQLEQIADNNPNANFDLILVMAALNLQHEQAQAYAKEAGDILKEYQVGFQRDLQEIDTQVDRLIKTLD